MLKAISGKGQVVYYTVIHNARLLQLVPLNDHKRKQNNLSSKKFIIYWIKRIKRKSGKVHAQSFNNKKKNK